MYDKYFREGAQGHLISGADIYQGVNEVREWEDMGMGGSFPVRRKRGVSRQDEVGPARGTVGLKQ